MKTHTATHTTETGVPLCNHVFPDGHRCGSFALRNQLRCYHHQSDKITRHRTRNLAERNRRRAFDITAPNTRREFPHTLSDLIQRIARNRIDPRRAGQLLFALQIAAATLPPI